MTPAELKSLYRGKIVEELKSPGPMTAGNLHRMYATAGTVEKEHLYVQALIDEMLNFSATSEVPKINTDSPGAVMNREIRERYAAGETQAAIAKDYGITQPIVSRIVRKGA